MGDGVVMDTIWPDVSVMDAIFFGMDIECPYSKHLTAGLQNRSVVMWMTNVKPQGSHSVAPVSI